MLVLTQFCNMLRFFIFAFSVFAPLFAFANAPGDTINHTHYFQNNGGCTMYIYGVTKKWISDTDSITTAHYGNSSTSLSSSSPDGSYSYRLSSAYPLPSGAYIDTSTHPSSLPSNVVNAGFTFETDPDSLGDTITSQVHWDYGFESGCVGSSVTNPTQVVSVLTLPLCGNGTVDSPEQCDDGNTASGDGCSNVCTSETSSGGGGGGSSSASSGSSSDSTNSAAVATNETCQLMLLDGACTEEAVVAAGEVPNLTPSVYNGKNVAVLQLDPDSPASCFTEDLVIQSRHSAIVGGYRNDMPSWSENIPSTDFAFDGTQLYVPIQYKTGYQLRAQVEGDSATMGGTCHFDTRIDQVDTTGYTSLDYATARNIMNPNISQLMQPFYDWDTRCSAQNGVLVTSLEPGSYYYDYGEGRWVDIALCMPPDRTDIVLFESLSGGFVLLDDSPTASAADIGVTPLPTSGGTFTVPDKAITLVAQGADIMLSDDIAYNSDDGSLGVMSLISSSYDADHGGNVLIHPDVRHVRGAYYLEGRAMSTDTSWRLPEQEWQHDFAPISESGQALSRNDDAWYSQLKHQLMVEGTIISRNTTESVVDPLMPIGEEDSWQRTRQSSCASLTFDGSYDCDWSEAVLQDIAYLREYSLCANDRSDTLFSSGYQPSSYCEDLGDAFAGGAAADEVDTNEIEPVVFRYDARVQTNPPPGFEDLGSATTAEIAQ